MPAAMSRLDTLAAAVPSGAVTVADIGHDHGILLATLLRSRPGLRAIGVERRPGAARDFAARFAAERPAWGARLSLREGLDFEALRPAEAQVVVMAGFGERAMLEALDRGETLGRLPQRLVLCPAGFEVALRPGLLERGWLFLDERLVLEGGRFFEVLSLGRGGEAPVGVAPESEAERRWGPVLLRRPDPLLPAFLTDLRRRQAAAVGRARGVGAQASALLSKLALLPELEGTRAR